MKEQIAKMISACDICIKYQPSKPQIEEVEKASPSTHPLHRVCLDLFTYNSSQYSILVDEYSGYFWIQRFKGTPTTDQLTKYLGNLFLETGVPSFLRTDDGGSMRGRFEMWCNDLGVVVEKSSAFNPISNGTAERHVQVAKRMLDISKEQKIPVEESRARLLASPSSIEGFSPSRLYFGRELRNPQLPAIPDGQEEELLGKQRQVTKDDDRIKRNSKVGKSLPRYVPKVGDLVLLQNQHTKRWDVPATVHLVRPGNRSAYVVAEDDGTMYLRSHTFLRLRQPVDSAMTQPRVLTQGQSAPPLMTQPRGPVTRSRAVANTSIVRHSYGKLPPRNLMAQLALSCTEEPGQSSSEEAPRKKVRFYLQCEHTDSTSDKRDVTCKGYPTEAGLRFDCCCRHTHPPTPFASQPTEKTMSRIKIILISQTSLVALAMAVVVAVKLLSDTSSEEIEVVEPYGDLHKGPEVFDFSNMNVAGSSTLVILGTLAAVSYFCRRRIISKLKRGQHPSSPLNPHQLPQPQLQPTTRPLVWHCSPTSTTRLCPSPSVDRSRISAASRSRSMLPASTPASLRLPAGSPPAGTSTGSSSASDCLPPTMQALHCPPPTERPWTWRMPCTASTRTRSKSPWPRPPTPPGSRGGGDHGRWGRGEEIQHLIAFTI